MEDPGSIHSDDSSELLPPPPAPLDEEEVIDNLDATEDEIQAPLDEEDGIDNLDVTEDETQENPVKISVETENAPTDPVVNEIPESFPKNPEEIPKAGSRNASPSGSQGEQEVSDPNSGVVGTDISIPTSAGGTDPQSSNIELRLNRALAGSSVQEKRRSPDLIPLTKNYHTFQKKLREVIAAVKAYSKATSDMHAARRKLYDVYSDMSEGTPLEDHVRKPMDPTALKRVEELGSMQKDKYDTDANGNEMASLAAAAQVDSINETVSGKEYDRFILDYALDWEKVVTGKLDAEIKEVQKLQRRRLHYERKVTGLRKRTNNMESKGKELPESLIEKLNRNEDKLKESFESHEQRSCDLCILLEEVTESGWKDLYPLLKNTMRYEVSRTQRDAACFSNLTTIIDAMKQKSFGPPQS